MTFIYYLAIAFVNILLSILSKSATLIVPFFISVLVLLCIFLADKYDRAEKLFSALVVVFGVTLSLYGAILTAATPVPILDYTVALTQGICGLLVTVSEPVVARLRS